MTFKKYLVAAVMLLGISSCSETPESVTAVTDGSAPLDKGITNCILNWYDDRADESKVNLQPSAAGEIISLLTEKFRERHVTVIPKTNVVSCDAVDNAVAHKFEHSDNELAGYYILYDEMWTKQVLGDDQNLAFLLFGHELGHIVNQDFDGDRAQVPRALREKDADAFAGCALAHMRGNIAAIDDLFPRLREELGVYYPSRTDSLEVAKNGYYACASPNLINTQIQILLDEKQFEIDAFDGVWGATTNRAASEFLSLIEAEDEYNIQREADRKKVVQLLRDSTGFSNRVFREVEAFEADYRECLLAQQNMSACGSPRLKTIVVSACKSTESCKQERTPTLASALNFQFFDDLFDGQVTQSLPAAFELTQEEYSSEVADDFLRRLEEASAVVDRLYGAQSDSDIPDNERYALASLILNIGVRNFEQSQMATLLRNGNKYAASNEFDRWVFANGQKLRGLVNRRACEKALFLGQVNFNSCAIVPEDFRISYESNVGALNQISELYFHVSDASDLNRAQTLALALQAAFPNVRVLGIEVIEDSADKGNSVRYYQTEQAEHAEELAAFIRKSWRSENGKSVEVGVIPLHGLYDDLPKESSEVWLN